METRLVVRGWLFVAVVAAGIALPHGLHAQDKLELTPYFGSFYAASKIRSVDDNDWERQRAGPGLGVQFRFRPSAAVGLEASGTYVFSGVIITDPNAISANESQSGYLIFANARVLIYPRRSNVRIILGGGIVTRGGSVWDSPSTTDLTDPAGVVGFAVRANVNRNIAFDIGAEVNLYVADPDGPTGTRYEDRFQQDILVIIGIPISLAR